MNQDTAVNEERRITKRKNSPSNLRIYCPQLNIAQCQPANLSTRGTFIDLIPEHAYVGRRVQLIFSISEGNIVRLIRVWGVVVHLSDTGIGIGFTHKYRPSRDDSNSIKSA